MYSIADVIQLIPNQIFHHAIAIPSYIHAQAEVTSAICTLSFCNGAASQVGQHFLGKLGAPLMITGVTFLSISEPQVNGEPQVKSSLQRIQIAALAGIMHYALLALNPFSRSFGATFITTTLASAVVLYPTYWPAPNADHPTPAVASKEKTGPRFSPSYHEFTNNPSTQNKVTAVRNQLVSYVTRFSTSMDDPKRRIEEAFSALHDRVKSIFTTTRPGDNDAPTRSTDER